MDIQKRLAELKTEQEKGNQRLLILDQQAGSIQQEMANLRAQLFKIAGAIQFAEEQLAEEPDLIPEDLNGQKKRRPKRKEKV